MKIDVPFCKQTTSLNCGPTNLRMVFSYFGDDFEIDFLDKKTGIRKGQAISTIKLAIVAAYLEYRVDFFSKHLALNPENLKMDFYKKHRDMNLEQSDELLREAKENGVNVLERTLGLEELLSYVTEDSVPIVLIDWNILSGKTGYAGHFIPIVGYDEENVYVHNCGWNNEKAFLPVKKNLFDAARKALGTDEDIVVIHRKA